MSATATLNGLGAMWSMCAVPRSETTAEHANAHDGDDSLILAAASGDRNAFGRLIDRHSARAFAVAYRMVGNRADAEDLVQEAFIRAWNHASRWQPGRAAFSTWLYRVVVNLGIDQKRRPRHDALDDAFDPMDDTPSADERIEDRQRSEAVRQATVSLPDRQRQAIALVYGAGISNKAAADTIGVSVKALESLLIRAKRTLRETLGSEND